MPHIDEATEETLGEDGESTSAVEIESLTTAKDKSKFTRLVNAAKVRTSLVGGKVNVLIASVNV